ncbi:unnamed protein product [Brachionus calyciflorus]|uniref:Uncharacterized protein n=1 Tax=Brachionus calyciflorus TaxID=104777 RepID=A0A814FAU2_9BILA|nr:unnamed protein product [Brachionus calyciflorus]
MKFLLSKNTTVIKDPRYTPGLFSSSNFQYGVYNHGKYETRSTNIELNLERSKHSNKNIDMNCCSETQIAQPIYFQEQPNYNVQYLSNGLNNEYTQYYNHLYQNSQLPVYQENASAIQLNNQAQLIQTNYLPFYNYQYDQQQDYSHNLVQNAQIYQNTPILHEQVYTHGNNEAVIRQANHLPVNYIENEKQEMFSRSKSLTQLNYNNEQSQYEHMRQRSATPVRKVNFEDLNSSSHSLNERFNSSIDLNRDKRTEYYLMNQYPESDNQYRSEIFVNVNKPISQNVQTIIPNHYYNNHLHQSSVVQSTQDIEEHSKSEFRNLSYTNNIKDPRHHQTVQRPFTPISILKTTKQNYNETKDENFRKQNLYRNKSMTNLSYDRSDLKLEENNSIQRSISPVLLRQRSSTPHKAVYFDNTNYHHKSSKEDFSSIDHKINQMNNLNSVHSSETRNRQMISNYESNQRFRHESFEDLR